MTFGYVPSHLQRIPVYTLPKTLRVLLLILVCNTTKKRLVLRRTWMFCLNAVFSVSDRWKLELLIVHSWADIIHIYAHTLRGRKDQARRKSCVYSLAPFRATTHSLSAWYYINNNIRHNGERRQQDRTGKLWTEREGTHAVTNTRNTICTCLLYTSPSPRD